ncbi:MAG: gephyrin-like molybdotransferase Glp [Pseudomonadales bacterium]
MSLAPVEEAQASLLADVIPVKECVTLSLRNCLGSVLASDLVSQIDVPPCDNSAMDGYAIRVSDSVNDALLLVKQKVFAGSSPKPLEAGEAARIFTGASIPENANAVVMQENCVEHESRLTIRAKAKVGDHIRPQGQDVRQGETVLSAGKRLSAQDVGLAASLGEVRLDVYRKLKVAILSTGDELLEPGMPPEPNKIYNSNRYLLHSLLTRLGIEVHDAGIVPDCLDDTKAMVLSLAENVDLIISSGGVSVGEADFVKNVIDELGELRFWKLAMKPGKPLAYGRVSGTPYFGLPGNPVSAFATFAVMVRPYLLQMQGVSGRVLPIAMKLPAAFDWPKAGTRQEYLRANIQHNEAGTAELALFSNQSSGVLSSVSWADGFVVVPPGQTFQTCDLVDFLPFEGLLA